MKKTLALILALVMVLSLAACGSESAATTTAEPAETTTETTAEAAEETTEAPAEGGYTLTEPVHLTFAAQEVGTGAYNYAAALQTVMLKVLPEGSTIDITTTSPGGVGAPVIVNAAEECDIVMSNAGPAKWSYEMSADEYEYGGCTEIACIAGTIGRNFVNVLFTQKFVDETGYTCLEDVIADKYPLKLVIKKNGTFGEVSAEKVMEALGVTFDDIISWGGVVEKTGGDGIKSGLQDDLYECTIDHLAAGQANTTELCMTHDMYTVQLKDETLEKLVGMGYNYLTIDANTWNRQTTEIKTVGSQQVILVSSTMDDAVAYYLTKAICENKSALEEADATMAYFDPTVSGASVNTGCPLHPGAAAYYKEVGYEYE